jgi:5-methylcytosine-specific restriction endonuclease McrA
MNAQPKPVPRIVEKLARRQRHTATIKTVRAAVWKRERGMCRICRVRPAKHLHELRFRSLGGRVSTANSIAVCAIDHQLLHAHVTRVMGTDADGDLKFSTQGL